MTRTLVTYSLRTIPFIFLVSNYIVTVDAVEGRAADSGSKAQKNSSSLVLVDRFSIKFGDRGFRKGDKVVMCDPYDPNKRVLRKIVVSSNDWVSIMDGGSPRVIFVPRGYCWVESTSPETRGSSEFDSRDYGPVSLGLIEGFAIKMPWNYFDFLFGGPK